MINYDKNNHTFYLNTLHSSYVISVWKEQKLIHRYWGKKLINPLAEIDLDEYCNRNWLPLDMEKYSSSIIPFEYSTWGNADMRTPAVEFTFSDGSRISNLVYKGYRITDGKPALEGLPAVYCEAEDKVQTLSICLEDTLQNVDVFLTYSVFEEMDAITRSVRIVNKGERLLVDLGHRLKDGHQNSHQHAQKQHRRTDLQRHADSLPHDIHYFHRLSSPDHWKPWTRVENSSCQPSSVINNSSLKGMEIMEGGSMIMPMDMSADATTTSISRKGMYRRANQPRAGALGIFPGPGSRRRPGNSLPPRR